MAAHPVALVAPAAPAGVAPKTRTIHATECNTPAYQQRRAQWRDEVARLAPARLVLVEESGVTPTMARRSGRGPRGERVHGDAPLRGWRVTTLLGAVALDGVRALLTVEAATDTEVCHDLIEQVLVPALRPGDIVVWDNLAPHQHPEVEALMAQATATVPRLPPYSPEDNPSESCWSKVKTHLRGAAARSKAALDQTIAAAWQAVTPSDAQGWFTLCGYRTPL